MTVLLATPPPTSGLVSTAFIQYLQSVRESLWYKVNLTRNSLHLFSDSISDLVWIYWTCSYLWIMKATRIFRTFYSRTSLQFYCISRSIGYYSKSKSCLILRLRKTNVSKKTFAKRNFCYLEKLKFGPETTSAWPIDLFLLLRKYLSSALKLTVAIALSMI